MSLYMSQMTCGLSDKVNKSMYVVLQLPNDMSSGLRYKVCKSMFTYKMLLHSSQKTWTCSMLIFLYKVFKYQSADMNTDSLAPGVQNAALA